MERDELREDEERRPTLWGYLRAFHGRMKMLDLETLNNRRVYYSVVMYRFLVLMIDGLINIGVSRRASSLTFTTILAIFPLLAVASSTIPFFFTQEREDEFLNVIEERLLPSSNATLFGLSFFDEEKPEPVIMGPQPPEPDNVRIPFLPPPAEQDKLRDKKLKELIQYQKEYSQRIRTFVHEVSGKFRAGATGAGVFGFVGLLVTTGLLYWTIESTVNEVWHTEHLASWTYTVRNFIAVQFLAPAVIALSIAGLTFAGSLFVRTEDAGPIMRHIQEFSGHLGFFTRMIPMLLVAFFLALAYCFIPVASVKFRYALLGGLVASTLWEFARYLFYFYIVMSTVNKTLQDALGLSIVFLIWLYVSWLILLIGHHVVYVSQNFQLLWGERQTSSTGMLDGRLMVAVMVLLARRFSASGGGLQEPQIRRALGVRSPDLQRTLATLRDAGLVSELKAETTWQIARPPDRISIGELFALGCDLSLLPIARMRKRSLVAHVFRDLQDRTLAVAEGESLADLLNRVARQQSQATELDLTDEALREAEVAEMQPTTAKETA